MLHESRWIQRTRLDPAKRDRNQAEKAGLMMLFNYTAVVDLHTAKIHPSVHEKPFKHLHDNTREHRQHRPGFFHYFSLLCVILPVQRLSSVFRILFVPQPSSSSSSEHLDQGAPNFFWFCTRSVKKFWVCTPMYVYLSINDLHILLYYILYKTYTKIDIYKG